MPEPKRAKLEQPRSVQFDGRLRTAQVITLDGRRMVLHPDKTANDARRFVDGVNSGQVVVEVTKIEN